MNKPMVTVVVYKRVPRLSRKVFDRCLARLDDMYQDVRVTPEARDAWYEALISLPDEAVEQAVQVWCSYAPNHPNCWDIGELATELFPERKLEMDPVATLAERARREELLEKFRADREGNQP